MGHSSSKNHVDRGYQDAQMRDLLTYTEPSEYNQRPKPRENDIEFEISRNIHETNKAIDFLATQMLLSITTRDDVSNLNANMLLFLDANNLSEPTTDPPSLSNLQTRSERELIPIRGFRRIVTHTQLASHLVDDVYSEQAKNVYKRFSFADHRARFSVEPSRLSKKPSGILQPGYGVDSLQDRRTSKWFSRTSSQENATSHQMREEVEKLKERLEKSGQLSDKKTRMSKLDESQDRSRNNDKSQVSQIAEEGSHFEAKILPGKQGILEEENKFMPPKKNTPKKTGTVARSVSQTRTKPKAGEDKSPNNSRKGSKNYGKEKEDAKCNRVANKEKIPVVVYKNLQKNNSSTPKKTNTTKPVLQSNVSSKKPQKLAAKVLSSNTATTPTRKKAPAATRSQTNLKKVDLNRSYRTQGGDSFEEQHDHLNESARTTPLNNVSLYQEAELNPINVDLDLKDLLQQSALMNKNYGPISGPPNQKGYYQPPQQYSMAHSYPNEALHHGAGWHPQVHQYQEPEQMHYEHQSQYVQHGYPDHSKYFSSNPQYSAREKVFIQNQGDLRDPEYEENHIVFHNGSPQKDRNMYYAQNY